MNKISIIIVSYNVRSYLSNSIDSILKSSVENFELIIVDNNSFDGTAEYISNNHPSIKLIANNSNVGFGKAANQGAKIATSEHLLILNPDTIIEEETLEKLINHIETNDKILPLSTFIKISIYSNIICRTSL